MTPRLVPLDVARRVRQSATGRRAARKAAEMDALWAAEAEVWGDMWAEDWDSPEDAVYDTWGAR